MTGNQEQLFRYLRTKRAGEVVSEQEILSQTRWQPSTLRTYRSKHYLDPFLARTSSGSYRVLCNGDQISERDIVNAFTQVRPGMFVPVEGLELSGSEAKYILKGRPLGRGAVAQVWPCMVSGSSQLRAAKIFDPRPDLLDPNVITNVRQRFLREAKNGRKISHPNLVAHRDSGEVEGTPFLIMDLAERSVASILANGSLDVDMSIFVMKCCLQGLEYLHAQNCEHRDVKPANILQFGGTFVLGDFGIVSWSEMNPAFTSAGTITRDSLQLGSWHYMAPEQRRNPHQVTPASDVYALGISWYEMLTGIMLDPAAAGAGQFDPPTSDSEIAAFIRNMVRFNPKERPTVTELLAFANSRAPASTITTGSLLPRTPVAEPLRTHILGREAGGVATTVPPVAASQSQSDLFH
jgi:serine/threonine protein kinase